MTLIQNQKLLAFRTPEEPYQYYTPKRLGNPDNPYFSFFDSLNSREVLFYQEKVLNEKSVFFHPGQEVDENFLNLVEFNLPQIETEEWDRLVSLYEYFAFKDSYSTNLKYVLDRGGLEVGTFLLLNSKENRLFFVVPEQTVTSTGISWEAMKKISAITLDGTESRLVEDGWWADEDIYFIGYCHSHNTIPLATPSCIDDRTELNMSGIHILLSTFKPTTISEDESGWSEYKASFTTTVTYTMRGKRYYYPENLLTDLIPEHTNLVSVPVEVLNFVKVHTPKKYVPTNQNKYALPSTKSNYDYSKYSQVNKTTPDELEQIRKEIAGVAWTLYQKGFTFNDVMKANPYQTIKDEFDILTTAYRSVGLEEATLLDWEYYEG